MHNCWINSRIKNQIILTINELNKYKPYIKIITSINLYTLTKKVKTIKNIVLSRYKTNCKLKNKYKGKLPIIKTQIKTRFNFNSIQKRLMKKKRQTGHLIKKNKINQTYLFLKQFKRIEQPTTLITTCRHSSKFLFIYIAELMEILSNAIYHEGKNFEFNKLLSFAIENKFKNIINFQEDSNELKSFSLIHLPEGPTVFFSIFNIKLSSNTKRCGRSTTDRPELIFNHFESKIGRGIKQIFKSLFYKNPQFTKRTLVDFHNINDFIFFRHYRFTFNKTISLFKDRNKHYPQNQFKIHLQELGPRFSLKFERLHRGIPKYKKQELV